MAALFFDDFSIKKYEIVSILDSNLLCYIKLITILLRVGVDEISHEVSQVTQGEVCSVLSPGSFSFGVVDEDYSFL